MRKLTFKDLRRFSQVYISKVIVRKLELRAKCFMFFNVKMLVLKKKKGLSYMQKQTKADEKDTHSRLC